MVWQEQVTNIFMLCNLVEDRVAKCAQYYPAATPVSFGPFTLTPQLSTTLSPGLLQRTFTLSQGSASRTITWVHYQSWPDHGVPTNYEDLTRLLAEIDKCAPTSPILVHCSAGVGRTGTVIALSILQDLVRKTRDLREAPAISIFSVVRRMREQRLSMVQTPDQYVLLYAFMAQWLSTLTS